MRIDKFFGKNLLVIALFFGALSAIAHAQIPREDVLICGLPGGSRFTLRASYEWHPSAKLTSHGAERLNQSDWNVYYNPRSGKGTQAPASVTHGLLGYQLLQACSDVGIIDGIPVVKYSFLQTKNIWFDVSLIPSKLVLSPTKSEQPPSVREKLDSMRLFPKFFYALVVPRNGRLVYEAPLINFDDDKNGKVVAVYKSMSKDEGESWDDPIITKSSEIYELGKPLLEQSFIARPICINGKSVDNARMQFNSLLNQDGQQQAAASRPMLPAC